METSLVSNSLLDGRFLYRDIPIPSRSLLPEHLEHAPVEYLYSVYTLVSPTGSNCKGDEEAHDNTQVPAFSTGFA